MVCDDERWGYDMNFFQRLFAKDEYIKMRRYQLACQELDRWLASDPKAVMIIKHIDDYANDRSALWPDKLRRQLSELDKNDVDNSKGPLEPPVF